ncbi:hypothetical protein [Streptomyces sp. NPDC056543]
MTDKPETTGQQMNRIIREQPPKSDRQRMLDNFRATWNRKKENRDA